MQAVAQHQVDLGRPMGLAFLERVEAVADLLRHEDQRKGQTRMVPRLGPEDTLQHQAWGKTLCDTVRSMPANLAKSSEWPCNGSNVPLASLCWSRSL